MIYSYSHSTISVLKNKQKDILKNVKVTDDSNTVQNGRDLITEMERLLRI